MKEMSIGNIIIYPLNTYLRYHSVFRDFGLVSWSFEEANYIISYTAFVTSIVYCIIIEEIII